MATIPARRWWVLCVLCGVGVIAFGVWFAGVLPAETCTGPLPAGVSSLLAYQFARTPADIEAVFGAAGTPCRAAMIAAMDQANTVDLFGFIATYSAFLACFFIAALHAGSGRVARVGLATVVAALAFDVLETATQLHITDQLPGTALSLRLLAVGSVGKFLALAALCVCAGAAMMRHAGVVGRLTGLVCIASGMLVVLGVTTPPMRSALSLGNAVAWLIIFLYAVTAALRGGAKA